MDLDNGTDRNVADFESHDYRYAIETQQHRHLGYWAAQFGVPVSKLLNAIREVGHDPSAVQRHLSAKEAAEMQMAAIESRLRGWEGALAKMLNEHPDDPQAWVSLGQQRAAMEADAGPHGKYVTDRVECILASLGLKDGEEQPE